MPEGHKTMAKLPSIQEVRACPHCGNDDEFYVVQTYSGRGTIASTQRSASAPFVRSVTKRWRAGMRAPIARITQIRNSIHESVANLRRPRA